MPSTSPTPPGGEEGLLSRLDRKHEDLLQRIDSLNEQILAALGEAGGAAVETSAEPTA
ncbi:MAG: hypothetical protein AAGJ46_05510 [Planctomycetota bacterium]